MQLYEKFEKKRKKFILWKDSDYFVGNELAKRNNCANVIIVWLQVTGDKFIPSEALQTHFSGKFFHFALFLFNFLILLE